MTRKEEIRQEVSRYLYEDFQPTGVITEDRLSIGIRCAKWADEHPCDPWRDAENDPPKNDDDVFVVFCEGAKGCGYYDSTIKVWRVYGWGIMDVKLWMPIPELPKGGTK